MRAANMIGRRYQFLIYHIWSCELGEASLALALLMSLERMHSGQWLSSFWPPSHFTRDSFRHSAETTQ